MTRAPITSTRTVAAPAAVVHDLLTDVAAWQLWSPHVARVDPTSGRVHDGQQLVVRPWFGPPTRMDVEHVEPGCGMTWSTTAAGHVLRYGQEIRQTGEDCCEVVFRAVVDGPAGALASRAAAPLSALGQRRRLARLAALAELVHSRDSGPPTGR